MSGMTKKNELLKNDGPLNEVLNKNGFRKNKALLNLASDKVRLPSLITGKSAGRHGMIKQLILLNSAVYGFYLFSSGPTGLMYKKYLTLGGGSAMSSVGLCHFSHTSFASFLFNSGILYTIGNSHALKYGCANFAMVAGAGMAGATALGMFHVYHNN